MASGLGPPAEAPSLEKVRILFLTLGDADFLADSLLHGLRTILGPRVVDFPRQDILYRDASAELLTRVHGRGFTLYGLLEEEPVDRFAPLQRVASGDFDVVVLADIWQQYGMFLQLQPFCDRVQLVALDGEDYFGLYPYAPGFWRNPRLWLLPRAHRRVKYFKRELTPATVKRRIVPRGVIPAPGAEILPIAFSIPEEKVATTLPDKRKPFPRHVVDPDVAGLVHAARTSYVFSDERSYFADLSESSFGVTTKRSGWDCLRHYELAANGCVLCFRAFGEKPNTCAPHGLNARNCIAYHDAVHLFRTIESLGSEEVTRLQAAALQWATRNTTRRRGEEFLSCLGILDSEADEVGQGACRPSR